MDHWLPIVSENNHRYKQVTLLLDDIAAFFLEKENFLDQNTGIFGGKSGVALFLIYYYEFTGNEVHVRKALDIIKEVFNDFKGNTYEPDFSFGQGVTGIGWMINHVNQIGVIDAEVESVFEAFYSTTYQLALDNLSSGNHSLYNGSIGLINTLIGNPECQQNQLINIINKIEEVFHAQENVYAQADSNLKTSEKEIAFSLSEGLSGFLVILSKCIIQNIHVDKSRALCKKISGFILNNYAENEKLFFPTNIGQKEYGPQSWLTGDLGILYSLIYYSRNIQDDELRGRSIAILDKYTINKTVSHPYLDNLSAGNVANCLLYMMICHLTQQHDHKEIANYWLEETLKKINADGFVEYDLSGTTWIKSYRSGLLFGLDGIGLALISSVSSISPLWTECIIL